MKDNNNVCMLSMFGINEVNQIYHEILCQLVLKNDLGEKLKQIAKNLLGGLSVVSSKISLVKKIIDSIIIRCWGQKPLYSTLKSSYIL